MIKNKFKIGDLVSVAGNSSRMYNTPTSEQWRRFGIVMETSGRTGLHSCWHIRIKFVADEETWYNSHLLNLEAKAKQ